MSCEPKEGLVAAFAAGVVFIKEVNYAAIGIRQINEHCLLSFGKGAAYDGDNPLVSSLPDFNAVKETLYHNQRLRWIGLHRSMAIENFQRFSESLRKLVFGCAFGRITRPTPGIGHELPRRVLNRNGDTARH